MLEAFFALPRVYKRILSVASDIFALTFSIWAAYALRLEQQYWLPDQKQALVAAITVLFTIAFFILLRAAIPRPRYDQLMSYGWLFLLPLSLVNLLVTGAIILVTA